jgi:pyruvate/2-oxoacid:ferredoxin oxidoreductase alpha subunit
MPERIMFTMGDIASAEGALSAGCRYFGGYPITPATEIAEWMALRMPEVGGSFVQYEETSCVAGRAQVSQLVVSRVMSCSPSGEATGTIRLSL